MTDIFAWLAGLLAALGIGAATPQGYNGYVEVDYIYPAASATGQIVALDAAEGSEVAVGSVLVRLASAQQQAAVEAAEARVAPANANLDNLMTGSRTDEIDVIRASLAKAQADHTLASDSAQRTQRLFDEGLVPQARLDQDLATLKSADAAVKQLEAQLKVAELPARDAQQVAAEANLAAARADARQAAANLADRTVLAPAAGRIDRVYFDVGETAAAAAPLLALIPADGYKVRFYVPEAERPSFAIGDSVQVSCDGCPIGLLAHVSYFAAEPQFTPPVIYSRDERNRLTYLTEAVLDDRSALRPGQPVVVERGK